MFDIVYFGWSIGSKTVRKHLSGGSIYTVYLVNLGVKKHWRIAFWTWHILSLAEAYCATRFYIFSFHKLQ